MSQTEIQEKISAARREADGLKDKIRAAKDQTADTSRESFSPGFCLQDRSLGEVVMMVAND